MPAETSVFRFLAAASLLAAAACRVAQSGDWPQILGPDRNGIAAAGPARTIPQNGGKPWGYAGCGRQSP
ncbi:MAG: hypothetical protein ACKOHG_21095, partial [Planctomycetia bacterium]